LKTKKPDLIVGAECGNCGEPIRPPEPHENPFECIRYLKNQLEIIRYELKDHRDTEVDYAHLRRDEY